MAYLEVPVSQELSEIGGAKASGAVTRYTFVNLDAGAGTLTTATSSAYNTGIATTSAATGRPCGVKFEGVTRLSVNAGTAILLGDSLKATTAGVGIKGATDKDKVSAIALEALGSGTGHILVRIFAGERSTS